MNATLLPVPEGFARRVARELGSTRLTLALLAIVAAVVVAHAQVEGGLAGPLAAPVT